MEFHKSQYEDDQNGQPGTSTEVDQQEGEAQTNQGQERSSNEEEESYILVRNRKRRAVKPPKRYAQADVISFALTIAEETNEIVPRSYKEVMKSKDKDLWLQAIEEEMIALKKINTWKLVDKPKNKKTVGCKWIFKKNDGIPRVEKARYKSQVSG